MAFEEYRKRNALTRIAELINFGQYSRDGDEDKLVEEVERVYLESIKVDRLERELKRLDKRCAELHQALRSKASARARSAIL